MSISKKDLPEIDYHFPEFQVDDYLDKVDLVDVSRFEGRYLYIVPALQASTAVQICY